MLEVISPITGKVSNKERREITIPTIITEPIKNPIPMTTPLKKFHFKELFFSSPVSVIA